MAEKPSYAPGTAPPYIQDPNGPFTPGAPPPPNPSPQMYPPQPQMYPHQPYPPTGAVHPSGYNTATPLHSLQRSSAPVDCPNCGYREMTKVEAQTGNTTHGWAAVLCCCFCLGCIPYLMSSLKDVDHKCAKCDVLLATWHNSGRVEVHVKPGAQMQMQMQPQPQTQTQPQPQAQSQPQIQTESQSQSQPQA